MSKRFQFIHEDFRDFNFEKDTAYLLSYFCSLDDDGSTFACVRSTTGLESALNTLLEKRFSYYGSVESLLDRSGVYFVLDELPPDGEYTPIGQVTDW